jgi:hypothetical protein
LDLGLGQPRGQVLDGVTGHGGAPVGISGSPSRRVEWASFEWIKASEGFGKGEG